MKNLLIIGVTIFMFFFKSSSHADYKKIFYDFKINSISGELINLNDYRGKPVLVVNTASYCGFTKQYDDMQELWEKYKDKNFIVIGVSSNDFNQELNSKEEVKKFCEVNFGINFPMTDITSVKGKTAHPFYKWVKSTNAFSPKWNFYKILINKSGQIEDTFSSMTKPKSTKLISAIEKIL